MIMESLDHLASLDREYYREKVRFSVVNAPPFQTGAIHDFFCSEPLTKGNDVSFSEMDLSIESSEFSVGGDDLELLSQQYEDLGDAYAHEIQLGDEGSHFLQGIYEMDFIGLYHRLKTPLGDKIHLNGCCVPGFRRLFVSVDGILHVCERMDDAYSVGNVREWIDPNLVKKLVDDYIEFSGDCFHCWACRLCKECFASLPTLGGKFDDQARERKCKGTRRHFNKILIQYYTILEENESSLDFLSERILD
jgi:radical SAM protein with 4Fe4S-binding SPASM domain